MIHESTFKRIEASTDDESIGKVFVVIAEDTRECLTCERVFSRRRSAEHALTICYPPASNAN
jgi:hypothetical protein